eukprot:CAMPEP_0180805146 /NCGR_PEP_ID=MMETSP1038_2-20121128/61853_1 /TAXON_ID=632150 /ORGANISM="Azadinium spinosum, Strain 3D9" /LENGTH=57 /DNA_ID=CAMNT_0022845665 /DNA_START=54 /DNA_END=223 /DNA_ORIENTATION=+
MEEQGRHPSAHRETCHTAVEGEACYSDVMYAKTEYILKHPEWYIGLTESSCFEEFQA